MKKTVTYFFINFSENKHTFHQINSNVCSPNCPLYVSQVSNLNSNYLYEKMLISNFFVFYFLFSRILRESRHSQYPRRNYFQAMCVKSVREVAHLRCYLRLPTARNQRLEQEKYKKLKLFKQKKMVKNLLKTLTLPPNNVGN